MAQSQVTVDDLLTLSTLSSKNFDSYMAKRGFVANSKSPEENTMAITFIKKIKKGKSIDTTGDFQTVDLYKKQDNYCFALHTSSHTEFIEGCNRLKKNVFFSSSSQDSAIRQQTLFFQRKNLTMRVDSCKQDDLTVYTFLLQRREWPDVSAIRYADDLLQFSSHEYLVSFFGEGNVKKDVYYFGEKELKKCSVLFGNTSRQAVFIWDDEKNLSKLSYILISGVLPNLDAVLYTRSISQNKWELKNGIYSGLGLKELLKLNGNKDFEFYGRNSEFAFMIAPQVTGDIDFKKVGIMLGCLDNSGSALLEKNKVSAAEALANDLSLYIFYIMISPL